MSIEDWRDEIDSIDRELLRLLNARLRIAIKLLGERIELVPRPTFAALFASLDEGVADYVLAPIQNSLAGIVPGIHDLMLERTLSLCGEVSITVEQNLICCPGALFEEIPAV